MVRSYTICELMQGQTNNKFPLLTWPIRRVGQNCIYIVYDRIFGDSPAKNNVYVPYIYGSGQPYPYPQCRCIKAPFDDVAGDGADLVVEPNFRAHFELPKAAVDHSSYTAFIATLPQLLVVEASQMGLLVVVIAQRMAREFESMVSEL